MIFLTIISAFLIALSPQVTDIPCSVCHTPDSWRPLANPLPFDHNQTSFSLEGQHKNAACIQCHTGETVSELHQFQLTQPECSYCHMDIHYNDFGQECERCHTNDSWVMDNWWKNHDQTLFPLTGAHKNVACGSCHGANFAWLAGNLTTECFDCHLRTYTEILLLGSHPENSDCIFCHNSRAWVPIDMSQHDYLFPIYTGKHKGEWTSCEAECHPNPDDYSDFSCGLNGVCHEHRQSKMDDEHDEESQYIYESQACYDCHPSGGKDDD